ncbi:MAG: DUF2249 domain-containing protein [Cellulomonas sp.]
MPPEADALVDGLTRTVARACRQLAEAGHPHQAGRLAADAWVLLRSTHPAQAQRLDGAMHHAARLEKQHPTAPGALTRTAPLAPTTPTSPETAMPQDDRIIDVRAEIPRTRHALIFQTFAELPAGTAFVLVNDHDPKPLYYQLAAENTDQFTWDYLEEGPEVWRVRIGTREAA